MPPLDQSRMRELLEKATPAPWGWLWCHGLSLACERHGRLFICDATRMGMNGATMRFVERETPTQGGLFKTFTPPKERRGVSDWLVDGDLTHDMRLIAELRNSAPALLDEIAALRRQVGEMSAKAAQLDEIDRLGAMTEEECRDIARSTLDAYSLLQRKASAFDAIASGRIIVTPRKRSINESLRGPAWSVARGDFDFPAHMAHVLIDRIESALGGDGGGM